MSTSLLDFAVGGAFMTKTVSEAKGTSTGKYVTKKS
jgi:hypothetical protein